MYFEHFQQNFQFFLVIFARIFGLLLVLPVFSGGIPPLFRAGASFFLALLSAPMIISMNILHIPAGLADYGIIVLANIIVGLAIGFVVQVTVSAIHSSSSVFSTTMGLSFSENIDPLTQVESPALGNLLSGLITLLFIRMEYHLIFIEIIIRSFQDFPIITSQNTQNLYIALKTSTSIILSLALQIAMPIIGITLLLDIAMGMIGRVAPQFNVMVMGWNIKIILGFLMLWFILPSLIDISGVIFKELHDSVLQLIRMKGTA